MQPINFLTLFLLLAFPAAHAASLQVRLSSAPNTLDWNIATSGSESAILQNIMEGLFSRNDLGTATEALAKSFSWSKDKKTLTVEIKPGILWTDGKELLARDFIHSFERLLNPNLNSENASLLFDVVGAREYFLAKSKSFSQVGIKATSDHGLQFQLKQARANFPEILSHYPTFPMRDDNPKATLGAYRIKSQTESVIKLHATRANLAIQDASFSVIPDGELAIRNFRKGKIDYLMQIDDSLMTSAAFTEQLKYLPRLGTVQEIHVVALLHINPGRMKTNTPEKRRAVMAEIPVKGLVDDHPQTRALAESIIPAGSLGGPSISSRNAFAPSGKIDRISISGLTLAYPDDAFSRSIAEEIQKNSGDLKIKIEALPKGELSSSSNRYDLVLTVFGLDYGDPDQLLSSFLSQGTHDLFNVSSAEYLGIIQSARETEDNTARGKLYAKAANLLENKIAIVMPLFYRKRSFLIRDRFVFDEKRQGTANLTQIHLKKP